MRSVELNGVRLEYDERGDGPPIVFVHGGLYADWFAHLVIEPALAGRVEQPLLAMLGASTHGVTPSFNQRHELLLDWLPNVEQYVLPDATHLMHVQNPADAAEHLAEFFDRHGLDR